MIKAIWKEYDMACACADISNAALRMGREPGFHRFQCRFWGMVKHNLRRRMRAASDHWLAPRPLLPG